MKSITIATAKIKPEIYQLIENGEKHYEARSESFENADVIRYVSSKTGRQLGCWTLAGSEFVFNSADKANEGVIAELARISDYDVQNMFGGMNVYVRRIGDRIYDDMDIVVERESHELPKS